MNPDPIATLRALPGLEDAEDRELNVLAAIAELRSFDHGAVIQHQDTPATHVHLLMSGRVAVVQEIGWGTRVSHFGLDPVCLLGPMHGDARLQTPFTIIALRPCRCLAIPRADLLAIEGGDSAMSFRVLDFLYRALLRQERAFSSYYCELYRDPGQVLSRYAEASGPRG